MGLTLGMLAAHGEAQAANVGCAWVLQEGQDLQENPGNVGAPEQRENRFLFSNGSSPAF